MNQEATVTPSEIEVLEAEEISLSRVEVLFAITASLDRDHDLTGSPFKAKTGEPWVLGDSTAQKFVEKIEEKFRKKNKLHGFFSGTIWHAMPEAIKKLLVVECEHLEFAAAVMKLLETSSNEVAGGNLSGGHIVFIMYRDHIKR